MLLKKNVFISFFLFLILASCSRQSFTIEVDAISSPTPVDASNYVLLSGEDEINADSLQFQEYATYVERALAEKGLKRTTDTSSADIAIFLGYGVGEPKTSTYTYSVPVWGQTGVSSSTTTGTVNTYGGLGTYSGTTTYTPTYGVTGYTTGSSNTTTYSRYMFLDAVDLVEYRKTEETRQVWKTTVTSTGSSGDLRQVFPILVVAAKDFFGTNTGKQVTVKLQETDPDVLEIKGIPID